MQVKLKVGFAGPDINWAQGQIVEISEEQGQRLIDAKYAEEILPLSDKEKKDELKKVFTTHISKNDLKKVGRPAKK